MNYQEAIKGYTGIIQAYALATRTHDSLAADAWAVMAREIDAALKNGKTYEQIKDDMKQAEDAWKASTGDTSMPSTYRSAKAVALKAVLNKIPLLEADGAVKGKTAIEQAYKAVEAAAASTAGEEKDKSLDLRQKMYRAIDKAWPVLSMTEKEALRAYVTVRP